MVYDESCFQIRPFTRIRLIDKDENRKINIKLLLVQVIITTGANIMPYNEGADTTKRVERLLLSTCGTSIFTQDLSGLSTHFVELLLCFLVMLLPLA